MGVFSCERDFKKSDPKMLLLNVLLAIDVYFFRYLKCFNNTCILPLDHFELRTFYTHCTYL